MFTFLVILKKFGKVYEKTNIDNIIGIEVKDEILLPKEISKSLLNRAIKAQTKNNRNKVLKFRNVKTLLR